MHAAFYNYPHYRGKYGANAAGEERWARESVQAFSRCAGNFSTASCALARGWRAPSTLYGGRRPIGLPAPSEGSGLAHAPRSAIVSRVEARRGLRSPPRARPQR